MEKNRINQSISFYSTSYRTGRMAAPNNNYV